MVSREFAERSSRLTDLLFVLAIFGSAVLGATLAFPDGARPRGVWVTIALAGVACLALLAARRCPRSAVVVTAACAVAIGALGYVLSPLLLAPVMVALYQLAAGTIPRVAWTYGGITTVFVVAAAVGTDGLDATVGVRVLGPALWLLLPLVLGSRSRLRRDYLDAIQLRAEHAERTREEEARLRVAEERMRIARDLHDVAAHHMAVANAQAGTAAHLLETDRALTKKLLADLQTTMSSVMLEMRDTIGVLRQTGDAEPVEPAPGLAQLPALLQAYEHAGLVVELTVEGERRDLPAGVDLTAYRIIQEALTNATKYAASTTALLCLRYGSTRLTITVTNDYRSGSGSGGFGLIGMRERAHSVGGELQVGAGERFEVVAHVPLRSEVRP